MASNDNANSPNGNFPFGSKEASGFAARVSSGTQMGPGLLRTNSRPMRVEPSLATGIVDGIPKISASTSEHLQKVDPSIRARFSDLVGRK